MRSLEMAATKKNLPDQIFGPNSNQEDFFRGNDTPYHFTTALPSVIATPLSWFMGKPDLIKTHNSEHLIFI